MLREFNLKLNFFFLGLYQITGRPMNARIVCLRNDIDDWDNYLNYKSSNLKNEGIIIYFSSVLIKKYNKLSWYSLIQILSHNLILEGNSPFYIKIM